MCSWTSRASSDSRRLARTMATCYFTDGEVGRAASPPGAPSALHVALVQPAIQFSADHIEDQDDVLADCFRLTGLLVPPGRRARELIMDGYAPLRIRQE